MKAVLDIGKTHIKLLFVKEEQQVASFSCKNAPIAGQYPQADVNSIWEWLIETLHSCTYTKQVEGLVITTHGATVALIDEREKNRQSALVVPVLDYEYDGLDEVSADYEEARPDFQETLSPSLPAGLNLGRQLFWLERSYPTEFAKVTSILLYPQYWAWRLGANVSSEVTSLGCHTDLWDPIKREYSSICKTNDWTKLFPPIKSAWDCIGEIRPEVSQATTLPTSCKIYCGIHDSNASYLRYLNLSSNHEQEFTVISTGTWTILMQANGQVSHLQSKPDTLANVDINGDPVCCARFMGGREYEKICTTLGGNIKMNPTESDIQRTIDNLWMVTPDFSNGNGPFGNYTPQLLCPKTPPAPQAIATLYCAMMISQRLDDLQAQGSIYIEGAFLKNPLLCGLVAQIRAGQSVFASTDDTGTVLGAASLINYQNENESNLEVSPVTKTDFVGLERYVDAWFKAINRKK
ncbi:FGGY family carbohydrate kinase [Paraglaciecola chathamensis]|uniref:FGGY-family carbohydrate kinase n=1 Tax=Paraglaciecola chathamensis TaxID=368405 RepID=UPI0026F63D4E|nr:FGGY family carbohydrate kinase [Paraglaciecola chathamensis]MDO6841931.1 FGGY family carbohydrate kinase [Paraglaciecola chathamensis]